MLELKGGWPTPAARTAAGFFAVTGAKSGAFPMSRAGAVWVPVLTKFQPNRLELLLEKADFRQKKAPFGSAKFGPVMPW